MFEFLRNYKLTYLLFNITKKKYLKHNLPLYKKYGINKKYYSLISSEDFRQKEQKLNKYDRFNSAQIMPEDPKFLALPKDIQPHLLPWSSEGYVVLPKFYDEVTIDAINQEVDLLIKNNKANHRYLNKIMFAIEQSKLLLEAGNNTRIKSVLEVLMNKPVKLFQSINFLTGSQQRTHSDFIHMTTYPYGNLIAIWVALEDIQEDSGPLHYYPGSHRLPYVLNRAYGNIGSRFKIGQKTYTDYEDHIGNIVEKNKFKKKIFLPKKGDVLIWHANLLHGGEKVRNEERSRKSMVFHYFTPDAICFHEVSQRPALYKNY